MTLPSSKFLRFKYLHAISQVQYILCWELLLPLLRPKEQPLLPSIVNVSVLSKILDTNSFFGGPGICIVILFTKKWKLPHILGLNLFALISILSEIPKSLYLFTLANITFVQVSVVCHWNFHSYNLIHYLILFCYLMILAYH